MEIKTLRSLPNYITTIANIYLQEWGWHFSKEWNIITLDDMIKDINDNFLDTTYIALINNIFVGTIALLDADLKSHMHIKPWITCLYVEPNFRKQGIGKKLVDFILQKVPTCYMWCYNQKERDLYLKWNFTIIEEITYDNKPAWILQKLEDI